MKFKIYFCFVFNVFILATRGQDQDENTCGYASCHKGVDDRLNIHLVCHSHDDVGWLKNVDQYYSGSYRTPWSGDTENQRAGVQYVLDTVVRELTYDKNKKYIQVETAFFWRWWSEQEQQMKDTVTDLVNSGQIEFIGGGWCMNDEAAAHYVAIIDQMSLGFKKLKDTFGDCGIPRVAWQIDPFGHSREQADIFAALGMDGLFFGRLDWREKHQRLTNRTAEMVWITSDENKENKQLFTGVLFNNYSPPEDFCWDLLCNDEPLMDNPSLHGYNMEIKARAFLDYVHNQQKYYATNHIMLTMGMDFHYQAAHSWYKNLDKLINYINTNMGESENVHLMYSTPLCYIKALSEQDVDWPTKSDDFFPYASDPHAYWTGYFTSRPNSKFFIREASRWLQLARGVTSRVMLTNFDESSTLVKATERLSRAVGVAQHHDAITGTEKQHVANDYHKRLHAGIQNFAATARSTICPMLNISQCEITETSDEIVLALYNPMPYKQSSIVHLPVATNSWLVSDDQGLSVEYQTAPIPEQVKNIPGRQSSAEYNLAFLAEDIPPLSVKSVLITKSQTKKNPSKQKELGFNKDYKISTKRGHFKVRLSQTGFSVKNEATNITVTHELAYYKGHPGNNSEFEFRASGAYIFRPLEQEPIKLNIVNSTMITGSVTTEIHINYDDHASLVHRIPNTPTLYDGEYEWLVGPISLDDGVGKEYISRWKIDNFKQDSIFYTDANGRQLIKRVRDYRPSFDPLNATLEEPVASNYYPINTGIIIRDESSNLQMAVVTDRAQGGSSLRDGEIELMIHRRLVDDDAFGVQEPLNELAYGQGIVARGKHYLILSNNAEEGNAKYRQLASHLFGEPLPLFPILGVETDHPMNLKPPHREYYEFPPNLNLITFDPLSNSSTGIGTKQFLVRIEHIFAEGEHSTLSLPVSVSLTKFFGPPGLGLGEVSLIRETTLGGNQWKDEAERLSWKWSDETLAGIDEEESKDVNPDEILMNPMEIRTFIIEFEKTY